METHHLCDQTFFLLRQKAIWWVEERALLIADPHFGKITHFRKSGIAVPDGAAMQNMVRLENLILEQRPEKVIFLGDLFHSEMNIEWVLFKEILKKYKSIEFHLIQGNHDILHETSYANCNFILHSNPWLLGPFLLSHEPESHPLYYNLCGHIHPGVRMIGKGRQSLRFPCFYFGEKQGILPAFGEFTGLCLLEPQKSDHVFIVTSNQVIKAA